MGGGFVHAPFDAEGGFGGVEEVLSVLHVEDGVLAVGVVGIAYGEPDPDGSDVAELVGVEAFVGVEFADDGACAGLLYAPAGDFEDDGFDAFVVDFAVGDVVAEGVFFDAVPAAEGEFAFDAFAWSEADAGGPGAVASASHADGVGLPEPEVGAVACEVHDGIRRRPCWYPGHDFHDTTNNRAWSGHQVDAEVWVGRDKCCLHNAGMTQAVMMALGVVLVFQPRVYDPSGSSMREVNAEHYVIRTDVADVVAREAKLRMDRMFEEYSRRTADFAKPIRQRLSLHLFSREADYFAAGGMEGTAGVFMVRGNDIRLMARYTGDWRTWHTTQHEGFHQFAYLSISPNLPPWVNEGLAEYFGEAIFTGDAMLSGVIPEYRRQRVARMIRENSHQPFETFLNMNIETWNRQMAAGNYDQAWSMVHFMAEGDSGRYQKAFLAYMKSAAQGNSPGKAWADATGNADPGSFEAAWKRFWLELPENPTSRLYSQARLMTLTSFLARASAQGQQFVSLREFTSAAQNDQVKMADESSPVWLPRKLLGPALEEVTSNATYTLTYLKNGAPRVSRSYADGSTVTVTFQPGAGGKSPRTVTEVRKR